MMHTGNTAKPRTREPFAMLVNFSAVNQYVTTDRC